MKPGMRMDDYYPLRRPPWNERKINNINRHFVTAFLGIYLWQKPYEKYLSLKENAAQNSWISFKPRTAVGLQLLYSNRINNK
jgi:hypothetical protein